LINLDRFGDRDRCGQLQQDVGMIVKATHSNRLHFVGASDSTHIGPETWLYRLFDGTDSVFG